jgi:hypothetical protein
MILNMLVVLASACLFALFLGLLLPSGRTAPEAEDLP